MVHVVNYLIKQKKKDISLLEQMKEEGICYHFTSFTYSYLKYIKLNNRFINRNNNEGNYVNVEKQYYDVYNNYDIINDNTLIEYFDEKDIIIYETLISNKL